MLNTTIDLESHKKLANKYVTNVTSSLLWREVLLQWIPIYILCIIAQDLLGDLDVMSGVFFGVGFLFAMIVLCLVTNQWIVNSLTRAKFKDFKICLVKDNQILDKMGFYDCAYWRGSLLWREFSLAIGWAVLISILDYFQLWPEVLSESMTNAIDRSLQAVMLMISLLWILNTKKTGRLVVLQPREESPPKGD